MTKIPRKKFHVRWNIVQWIGNLLWMQPTQFSLWHPSGPLTVRRNHWTTLGVVPKPTKQFLRSLRQYSGSGTCIPYSDLVPTEAHSWSLDHHQERSLRTVRSETISEKEREQRDDVCMCVLETERESERERKWKRERERKRERKKKRKRVSKLFCECWGRFLPLSGSFSRWIKGTENSGHSQIAPTD